MFELLLLANALAAPAAATPPPVERPAIELIEFLGAWDPEDPVFEGYDPERASTDAPETDDPETDTPGVGSPDLEVNPADTQTPAISEPSSPEENP